MNEKKKKLLKNLLNFDIFVGSVLVGASVFVILFLLVPEIFYSLFPQAIQNESKSVQLPVVDEEELAEEIDNEPEPEYPPQDLSLTTQPTLIIEKIGVNAVIQTGTNSQVALDEGPWVVPTLGTPMSNDLPIVIASHRWGAVDWTKEERTLKSFYTLPTLKEGDEVEIIWDQRIFEYKVTKVEESTQITDYNVNLILYTCKVIWQSPVRIFVYAEQTN